MPGGPPRPLGPPRAGGPLLEPPEGAAAGESVIFLEKPEV